MPAHAPRALRGRRPRWLRGFVRVLESVLNRICGQHACCCPVRSGRMLCAAAGGDRRCEGLFVHVSVYLRSYIKTLRSWERALAELKGREVKGCCACLGSSVS